MKNFARDFRDNSSFTAVKIITVVLAAMTTAFVSSKVSSFSGGVVVAGVLSFVSFTAKELYEWLFSKTRDFVTKSPTDSSDPASAERSTLESDGAVETAVSKPRPSVLRVLFRKSAFKYSFLFFAVTVVSLTVNVLMPHTIENVAVNPVTRVESTVTDSEKQDIIDKATDKVLSQLPKKTTEKEAPKESVEEQPQSLNPKADELQHKVAEVQKENDELKKAVESLKADMEKLKQQKAEVGDGSQSGGSTPEPAH